LGNQGDEQRMGLWSFLVPVGVATSGSAKSLTVADLTRSYQPLTAAKTISRDIGRTAIQRLQRFDIN
jgi:hypothetical protein